MCLVTVLLVVVVPAVAAPATEVEVNRLVCLLGNDSFAEREAATRRLEALGECALPTLIGAKSSPDPEVRRRVARLLYPFREQERRREIQAIKSSEMSPEEKGQRLKAFFNEGMKQQAVETALGRGDILLDLHVLGDNNECVMIVYYKRYAMTICFVKLLSDVSRIHDVRVREKSQR